MRFNQAMGGPLVGLPSRSARGTVRPSAKGSGAEARAKRCERETADWSPARAGAQRGQPATQRMHWPSCRCSWSFRSEGVPASCPQTDQARSRSRAALAESPGWGIKPSRTGSNKTAMSQRAKQWRFCLSPCSC